MDTRLVVENKEYKRHRIGEDINLFKGYVENYEFADDKVLHKLAKDLGFSYELYHTLESIDNRAALTMLQSMSAQTKHSEILLLVDNETNQILDYSLDYERAPILNSEFIKRVVSLSETSDEITLSEIYYHKEDKISSAILRRNAPIIIEEKYEGKESKFVEYSIGVLLINDEVNTTYSRLVLYVDDQPLYLPASYYNTTTSRYRRSTSSSVEALEVLLLKVIDDLRGDSFQSKIHNLHYVYRSNKYIVASYEEYNTLLRTMRKIPSIIEDNSFLESLLCQYEEFEEKYPLVEDKKTSYIWRCTALSDINLGALLLITTKILRDLSAPSIEYFDIRELLGTYMSTNRIAEEIAYEEGV